MAEPFTSKNWRIWVQPDGPNTDMSLIGCADTDDLEEPGLGINEIIRCFRADGSGWDVLGVTRNPPDPVETTITDLVETTASWLELLKEAGCPFPLYFNGRTCPPHDIFPGAARTIAFQSAEIGALTLTGLAMREEDTPTTRAAEITAWPPGINYRSVVAARQTIAEYSALNDIHFCNSIRCAGDCGDAMSPCTVGVAVSDAPTGSPAVVGDVWYTTDGGATWTATAADPFIAAEDVEAGICFPISDTVTRLLVAREPVVGSPAQVSYSDDWGANWTDVDLGTPDGIGTVHGGALFVLDMYHVWWVGEEGHVAFSSSGGVAWTMQQVGAGKLTAEDLTGIWFADNEHGMAVGLNDTVLVTADGGVTWALGTATGSGDDLLTVTENEGGGIWWAGDDDAGLWYSTDQGTTWTARVVAVSAASDIHSIRFVNTLSGWMIESTTGTSGWLWRTRNGGRDWERLNTVTNRGLKAMHACTPNMAYAVGLPSPAVGGTAVILKANG